MGRPRGFDEAEILRSAAGAFIEGGYEGTSIDDLVRALQLHRGSLYQAFGSKRGLFLAVLRHHVQTRLPAVTLGSGDPDELAEILIHGPDLDLLLVAALERGHRDPEVAALVRRALDALDHATRPAHAHPAEAHPAEAHPAEAHPADANDAPNPARAIELLGARLYQRLHQAPAPAIPAQPTSKEF